MDEKMRAEFEAFWSAPEQEELRMSCAKGWAMTIWQASRAALAVELPEQSPETPFSRHMVMDSSSVIEAIEAAGVRVEE